MWTSVNDQGACKEGSMVPGRIAEIGVEYALASERLYPEGAEVLLEYARTMRAGPGIWSPSGPGRVGSARWSRATSNASTMAGTVGPTPSNCPRPAISGSTARRTLTVPMSSLSPPLVQLHAVTIEPDAAPVHQARIGNSCPRCRCADAKL